MAFELRTLNTTDIFPMATILSKIGLDQIGATLDRSSLQKIAEAARDKAAAVEGGTGEESKDIMDIFAGINMTARIANVILMNLPKCEKEIYTLLAGVSGLTIKQVKELPIDEFAEMIVAILNKEEFKSFFRVALSFVA